MDVDFARNVQPKQIARSYIKRYGDWAVLKASMRERFNTASGDLRRAVFWSEVVYAVREILKSSPVAQPSPTFSLYSSAQEATAEIRDGYARRVRASSDYH